jgi:hypothetical protein
MECGSGVPRSGEAKAKPLSSEPMIVGQACNLQHLAKGPCVFASTRRCARFELLSYLIVLEPDDLNLQLCRSFCINSASSELLNPPLSTAILVLASRPHLLPVGLGRGCRHLPHPHLRFEILLNRHRL